MKHGHVPLVEVVVVAQPTITSSSYEKLRLIVFGTLCEINYIFINI